MVACTITDASPGLVEASPGLMEASYNQLRWQNFQKRVPQIILATLGQQHAAIAKPPRMPQNGNNASGPTKPIAMASPGMYDMRHAYMYIWLHIIYYIDTCK